MSFLRRVANLARGTFTVKVRDWSAPADEPDPPPSVTRTVPEAAPPAALPERPAPERDEQGTIKRTL